MKMSAPLLLERVKRPLRTKRLVAGGAAMLWQRALLSVSQLLVIGYLLWCCFAYGLPPFVLGIVVVAGLACVPVDAALFSALDEAEAKEDAANRVRFLEEQMHAREEYEGLFAQQLAEAAQIRFQVARQLAEARSRLIAKNGEEAAMWMEHAVGTMDIAPVRYCENHAVDALVSLKARDLEKAGIRASFEMDVPENLPFPCVELCAVFANLLDNAFNANALSREANRWVSMKAGLRSGFFVIDARNAVFPASRCDGAVTREESGSHRRSADRLLSEHGWGLAIVEGIAARHGGDMTIAVDGEEAHVVVMLGMGDCRENG